jgi:uncharacterized protein
MPPLHIDADDKLAITSEDVIGKSVAILGITGSGKSNSASVFVEELLDAGIPLSVVDIEGEYWGLKERYEILVAGGDHADIPLSAATAEALAEFSVTRRIPVILDIGELSQDEMFGYLLAYFNRLWAVCKVVSSPYQVILEEAHEFVPQGARTPLKEILTRIALRGRKRGLAMVLVSQRSPKVDKDLLTQAQLLFLHLVVHPVDLRVYEDLIPLPARQVDDMVSGLAPGHAVVLYKNTPVVAAIRMRRTIHGGATPSLEAVARPSLREIDPAILDELRATAEVEPGSDEPPERDRFEQPDPAAERQIEELKREIEALKLERQQLCDQLAARQAVVVSTPGTEYRQEVLLQSDGQPPTPDPEGSEPHLSELARKRRVNEQQRKFEFLVKDILGLRKFQQKMLRYLLEREGREFSRRDIARGTDISQTTLEKAGDVDLVQLEMISRRGVGKDARYTATARARFEKDFPLLDADDLRDDLLLKLTTRELRK